VSEKLLVALISGSAAFLGALVAFVGTWITARRSKELRRDELVRDKRGDILPEISIRLYDLIDALRSLTQPIAGRDEQGDLDQRAVAEYVMGRTASTKQLINQLVELNHYHKRNSIWIPKKLAVPIDELISTLINKAQRYTDFVLDNVQSAHQAADNEALYAKWSADIEEVKRMAAPAENPPAESRFSAEPGSKGEEAAAQFNEVIDEVMAQSKERLEEGRATLKQLGWTEDDEKKHADRRAQSAGKTHEEIVLDIFLEKLANLNEAFRTWLDGEGMRKWKDINELSRRVLKVD
jgi:hypothetical protein